MNLRALNVLTGPNGSGKSNFLQAFSLLTTLPDGERFQTTLRAGGGATAWPFRGGDVSTIELELSGAQDRTFEYRLAWAPSARGSARASILRECFIEQPSATRPAMTYFRADGAKVELSTQYIGRLGPEPYKTELLDRQFFKDSTSS